MEDPVFLFYRNLHGHPLAGLFWERQFERVLLEHGWEKVPDWECLFVNRDDITMAGKQQNIDPMWKVLVKDVDLGEPTSLLDHDHLGCTQRECETSKNLEDNHRNMFESGISAGASEKLACTGKPGADIFSCREMCGAILRAGEQNSQQLYNVTTPCLGDHPFKEEELGSVGELSKVCSQIVFKCTYLARIG